jgi:RND family efflux transporter MFP subunit
VSFAVACSNKSDAPKAKTRPPPLVSIARVDVRDMNVEVRAPVELRPILSADVGSKNLGYLDAVLVDRGDKIKRGQLLALVRPSDLPDQLAVARGQLAASEASLALAQTEAENAHKLAKTGAISEQALLQAQTSLAASTASREAARAQTTGLAVRLGETRINSPLDGIVSARRLDPGALVGPATGTILTVVNIDVLRVFVTIPERDIRGIAVGKDAHVELDALPGRSFQAKVVRIPPTLDPTTRTLDAEVHLTNPNGDLRPGMFGRGSVIIEVHPKVPVVSVNALQISGGKRYVYALVGEDKVERRAVETGVDEGDRIEIRSGLKDGEDVVIAGIDGLSDGATVRVLRNVSPYTGQKSESAEIEKKPASTPGPAPAIRN